MLSIRALARSAPRALPRLSTPSILGRLPVVRPSLVPLFRPIQRVNFTVSAFRYDVAGETDAELSAKLENEIKFEEEVTQSEQLPASVKDFLENGSFELVDVPGQEEVKLVRSYGEERITVSFSIADLAFDQDLAEEDEAFDDEELDTDSLQNPNQQRGVSAQGGSRSAPAEAIEEDEEEGDMDGEVVPPVRLSIVVEKPGKGSGALSIEATAQDGEISVDNVHYYPEAKQAFASSAEASHGRAQVYPGPPFGTLEEDLQVLVEQYLEERGVTPALAVFAPEYVNWKEQQEYVAWLKNVKSFVDL